MIMDLLRVSSSDETCSKSTVINAINMKVAAKLFVFCLLTTEDGEAFASRKYLYPTEVPLAHVDTDRIPREHSPRVEAEGRLREYQGFHSRCD